MVETKKMTIVRVGNYYFCPVCNDRLLVDKKRKTYFCICCGFSAKGE